MKKIIYISLISLIISNTAHCEIKQITLKIDGIDNEFCAYSLGQKLATIDGVREAKINPSSNSATLILNEHKKVSIANIEQLLKNTQFNIKNYRISAVGRIQKRNNNFVFSIKENPYQIYLMQEREGIKEAENKSKSITSILKDKIKGLFSVTMKKITSEDKLHNKIKSCYEKNSIVEIECNIHKHRNGFLLGLADSNARLQELDSKWIEKKS